MEQYAKKLRDKLNAIIAEMAQNHYTWVKNPHSDFIRNRKITFTNLIHILLSAGGNSLNKELFDYFKPTDTSVTASAFVQQRSKLLPQTLDYLFHKFNSVCNDDKLYRGYRLLAVDGSVMNYACSKGTDTLIHKSVTRGNQYHVNALYDLLNKTYTDVIVQHQSEVNEPKAAWQMMERIPHAEKVIMIADRGYGGINLIEHLNRIVNAEYIIRIKNNLWKELKDLPMTDLDTTITINLCTTQTNVDKNKYAECKAKWIAGHGKHRKLLHAIWDFESPYSVTIRIVRFQGERTRICVNPKVCYY